VRRKTFDLNLSSLRIQQGLSQRELARRMGIAQPSLTQIEDDFNDIRLSSLKKYVAALGMSLTVQVKMTDGSGKFYISKEEQEMDKNSFFKKLESSNTKANSEIAEQEKKIQTRKKNDEERLILFKFEADKLSNDIKEKLEESLKVHQYKKVVHSDFFQAEVLSTDISHGSINISFTPTGPKFLSALGDGVIEINSNSIYFRRNPQVELCLMLKNEKNDIHWRIHERDGVSGMWSQKRLDDESFYKILDQLIFTDS
jgi:transcriptional regulator with XRE-family HTH domain